MLSKKKKSKISRVDLFFSSKIKKIPRKFAKKITLCKLSESINVGITGIKNDKIILHSCTNILEV